MIGQLHGGYAACGNDSEDWYGRFYTSWTAGSSPSSRLSDHLDPDNTGNTICDTLPGVGMSVQPAGDTVHSCIGGCQNPMPDMVVYTIQNASPDAIAWSASIKGSSFLSINGASSGTLAPDGTVDLIVVVEAAGWMNGSYESVLSIFDDTNGIEMNRNHTLEIGLTGFDVTPENDFIAGGPLGGPFTTTQSYTVVSNRPSPFTMQVSANVPWISFNGGAGPVEYDFNGLGETAVIVVGFSDAADNLPAGLAYGAVTFDNLDPVGRRRHKPRRRTRCWTLCIYGLRRANSDRG